MKRHLAVLGIVLAFFAFAICEGARAEDPVKDAKEAFAKLVDAAKAKKTDEARKYITKEFIEVMGKELDRWLVDVGKVDPNAVEAAVKGKGVRIKFEKIEPGMTFYFVADVIKDSGQWKVVGPL